MFESEDLRVLAQALGTLSTGFESLPAFSAPADDTRLAEVLQETAARLRDNFPYPHPLYAGQMMKPPHAVARLAYMLALYLNPNNHALDGGRASSAMEKEAVANLAHMFGYTEHLGHLCASGTIANLEALWVARHLHPQGVVLASQEAHYTHARMCEVLGVPFETVAVDSAGCMDLDALEVRLRQGDVATVVATLGTTALGAVDPLPGILELRARHGFRIHADAAYGGYFMLAGNLGAPARAAFDALSQADSIVVDPHKHGLQPYGCGCVLLRDPGEGRFYKHNSPYTYFTSHAMHLGEISLECSRPGASAVALWATQRLLPMERGGDFARGLESGRDAALALYRHLETVSGYLAAPEPELDIVVWTVAAPSRGAASRRAQAVFDAAAQHGLHLALLKVPATLASRWWPELGADAEAVTALRSCLMKPEHREWLARILSLLDAATQQAAGA